MALEALAMNLEEDNAAFLFCGRCLLNTLPSEGQREEKSQAVKKGPRFSTRKASQSQLPRGSGRMGAQHEQRAGKQRKGPQGH